MNCLIIFAHPEPRSLNGRLKSRSVAALEAAGHTVKVSDLYGQGFRAAAGPGDFTRRANSDYFDLQKEQLYALEHGTFVPEIAAEQDKLRWADLLVVHFPFWWYSMPAVVKGYFDRVFSVGFAYGGAHELAGKQALLCTTTGSPDSWLSDDQPPGSVERIFHHILYGTFAFCEMKVLMPYIVYKAKRLEEEEKKRVLEEWGGILRNLNKRVVLY